LNLLLWHIGSLPFGEHQVSDQQYPFELDGHCDFFLKSGPESLPASFPRMLALQSFPTFRQMK
jgi:hypothetical protein